MQRKWLCYSSEDNFVYCRYCWLFGDAGDLTYQSSWVSGINDWQQLSKKQGRIQAGPAGPFGPGLSLKRGPPFGVIYTTYFFVVTVNIFRKNFHETDFGYDISNTLNISSGIALE